MPAGIRNGSLQPRQRIFFPSTAGVTKNCRSQCGHSSTSSADSIDQPLCVSRPDVAAAMIAVFPPSREAPAG